MIQKMLKVICGGICAISVSGISLASATTVTPPNQNDISITVLHNDGHTTFDVSKNGSTIIYMDPPLGGP